MVNDHGQSGTAMRRTRPAPPCFAVARCNLPPHTDYPAAAVTTTLRPARPGADPVAVRDGSAVGAPTLSDDHTS
jgi:hypothetical protein